MKKIAVILAGCGRHDGSEIHESVLTLLSIRQFGANYQCFSLNENQDHVSNHLTNELSIGESRNMLIESARIARGNIKNLSELTINEYDALIIPGGNGIAYNLFTLANDGANFMIKSLVKDFCNQFTDAKKPVGFICIAPVMIPKIYTDKINMTIGSDPDTTQLVESLGAIHHNCTVDEICVDEAHKIVTTPAYMLADNILAAYTGINKLVKKVIDYI
ncbi:MAG: isoprenoid biosynthesis glyoxalase ElbB [Burkholderiales bacterium]|nr:isoprenoid biosynthesis glyoxalase ElbB [Burkholderiales bacterium]